MENEVAPYVRKYVKVQIITSASGAALQAAMNTALDTLFNDEAHKWDIMATEIYHDGENHVGAITYYSQWRNDTTETSL